jgi:DNA-binding NarL/FixJ family response regulator
VEALRVAVVEEDEILRRGIAAILEEDDCELVILGTAQASSHEKQTTEENLDVAVVCSESLERVEVSCPVVVLTRHEATKDVSRHGDPRIKAILPHEGLTRDELVAGVRAAAAGLQVEPPDRSDHGEVLDARRVRVLRLLAEGSDTRAIARSLGISERTVKTLVRDIQLTLGATNRAQAVAEGMRLGLI